MFRFTEYVIERDAVESWLRHFESRGIPAGLVSRHNFGWSVWRDGKEIRVNDEWREDSAHGWLVDAVSGFEEQWPRQLLRLVEKGSDALR